MNVKAERMHDRTAPEAAPEDDVRVPVALGSRRYDIVIGPGLIGRAGSLIRALDHKAACAVVTDRNVEACHGGALRAGLDIQIRRRHQQLTP